VQSTTAALTNLLAASLLLFTGVHDENEILMRYLMKILSIVWMATVLAGCSSMSEADVKARSQRNLCEVQRSWEPYIPHQCGE
jgi:hypothetical protein